MDNKLVVKPPKTEVGNRTITIDYRTIVTLKKTNTKQAQILIGFGFNAMIPKQLLFSQVETNKHLYLTAPRNKLAHLCRLNDLEIINVHGFRHTHCGLLLEPDVSIKDVKA